MDARGLVCPLPLVELRRAPMPVEAGRRIRLLALDPQSPGDVGAFGEASGHLPVGVEERGDAFVILVEERGGRAALHPRASWAMVAPLPRAPSGEVDP